MTFLIIQWNHPYNLICSFIYIICDTFQTLDVLVLWNQEFPNYVNLILVNMSQLNTLVVLNVLTQKHNKMTRITQCEWMYIAQYFSALKLRKIALVIYQFEWHPFFWVKHKAVWNEFDTGFMSFFGYKFDCG